MCICGDMEMLNSHRNESRSQSFPLQCERGCCSQIWLHLAAWLGFFCCLLCGVLSIAGGKRKQSFPSSSRSLALLPCHGAKGFCGKMAEQKPFSPLENITHNLRSAWSLNYLYPAKEMAQCSRLLRSYVFDTLFLLTNSTKSSIHHHNDWTKQTLNNFETA